MKTFAIPTKNLTVTSDVYFTFPDGSEINFANGKGFDNLTPENSTGEWFWMFDNYSFQMRDANMTITNYFSGFGQGNTRLGFTLYGESGNTSTTKLYTSLLGKPKYVRVNGVNVPFAYDEATGILTISIVHSSPEEVEIDWELYYTEIRDAVIGRGFS